MTVLNGMIVADFLGQQDGQIKRFEKMGQQKLLDRERHLLFHTSKLLDLTAPSEIKLSR
jgi:hypothetical protein